MRAVVAEVRWSWISNQILLNLLPLEEYFLSLLHIHNPDKSVRGLVNILVEPVHRIAIIKVPLVFRWR